MMTKKKKIGEGEDKMKVLCDKYSSESDKFTLMETSRNCKNVYSIIFTLSRSIIISWFRIRKNLFFYCYYGRNKMYKSFIMTPASLEKNYKTQLKECGDKLYRLNQHWVKKSIDLKNKDSVNEMIKLLSVEKKNYKKCWRRLVFRCF